MPLATPSLMLHFSALAVGAGSGLAIGALLRVTEMDRERAVYPVLLVVIASYYLLFSVMVPDWTGFALEAVFFALWLVLAIWGYRRNLWIVVWGLIGHGLLDAFHGGLHPAPGAPLWWPGFCAGVDVVAGLVLAVLLRKGMVAAAQS